MKLHRTSLPALCMPDAPTLTRDAAARWQHTNPTTRDAMRSHAAHVRSPVQEVQHQLTASATSTPIRVECVAHFMEEDGDLDKAGGNETGVEIALCISKTGNETYEVEADEQFVNIDDGDLVELELHVAPNLHALSGSTVLYQALSVRLIEDSAVTIARARAKYNVELAAPGGVTTVKKVGMRVIFSDGVEFGSDSSMSWMNETTRRLSMLYVPTWRPPAEPSRASTRRLCSLLRYPFR